MQRRLNVRTAFDWWQQQLAGYGRWPSSRRASAIKWCCARQSGFRPPDAPLAVPPGSRAADKSAEQRFGTTGRAAPPSEWGRFQRTSQHPRGSVRPRGSAQLDLTSCGGCRRTTARATPSNAEASADCAEVTADANASDHGQWRFSFRKKSSK